MNNNDKTLERLKETRETVSRIVANLPPLTPDREEVLGLRYRKGDKVIDERTGKEYTVIAGTRKSVAI